MAIITLKPLFKDIKGVLGKTDNTIGISPALKVNVQNRQEGMRLQKKTAMPKGGSPARHERSRIYCACDAEYKTVFETKMAYLRAYYLAQHELTKIDLTDFQIFMKLCLGARPEKALFEEFSYFSRYFIQNNTATDWDNFIVRLTGIPIKRGDGKDVMIFYTDELFDITTEAGHKIDAPMSALVKVSIKAGGGFLILDLYSYSDYQHYEEW